jgi:hypothetical protein
LIAHPLAKSVYNQLDRFVLVSISNQPVRPSPQQPVEHLCFLNSVAGSLDCFFQSESIAIMCGAFFAPPPPAQITPPYCSFTDSYGSGIFACHKHPEVQKFKPQALQLSKA